MSRSIPMASLLKDIRACRVCEPELPLGANPIIRMAESARVLVVGQAPGSRVHQTNIPWNDLSGTRLREWMGVSAANFYGNPGIAIVPMGFCYPGKGKSGDLPPRKECAQLWRPKIHKLLSDVQLTLLIGQYAQNYYLQHEYKSLTEVVAHWQEFMPSFFPIPHPSPRNNLWLRKNPWFDEVIAALQASVQKALSIVPPAAQTDCNTNF